MWRPVAADLATALGTIRSCSVNVIVCGHFVRGDDHKHFEYEANVEPEGLNFTWVARVTSNGQFVGRLTGNLWKADTLSAGAIDDRVRRLMEALIANRLGVD
jgi:hypothetical protein